MSFSKLGLNKNSLTYIKEKSFKTPTKIQTLVIPEIIEGNSVVALAPTGTGKTLSFSLPLMEKVKEVENDLKKEKGSPLAIILSPIKELSYQIYEELKDISHHHKMRVRKLLGGTTSKGTKELARKEFEILVASPERLASAVKNKEIKLDQVQFFILDEADQLLDLGFSNTIEKFYKEMRSPVVGLFSATVPEKLEDFLKEPFQGLKFKKLVDEGAHKVAGNIETFNISVEIGKKNDFALEFILSSAKGQGLLFCNLKKNVKDLEKYLIAKREELLEKQKNTKNKQVKKLKIPSFAVFHGDLEAKERTKIITDFKKKKFSFLICSDIAARGLHIQQLTWILNYDLPSTPLYYLHRAGRTGRQGAPGKVFNFVTKAKRDQLNIQKINKTIKNQLSFQIDEINYLDSAIKAKELAKKTFKKKKTKKKVKKKITKRDDVNKKNIVKKKKTVSKKKTGKKKVIKRTPRFSRRNKKK